MSVTIEQLETWMKSFENEHLEFKEAKNKFEFKKLLNYCVAIANEGGGHIILGVTDKMPRKVVGTSAFKNIEKIKADIIEHLKMRIDIDLLTHPDGRVLVFDIPSRPTGRPIQHKGAYWMRCGEDIVPMTPDKIDRILKESQSDFTSGIEPNASISDLDQDAIEIFREMWLRRSKNMALKHLLHEQLLRDAELLIDDGVTFAALILLGTRESLGKHLANAEVVFEYRSSESSLVYQQRIEYREGFFLFQDDLWNTINLRNEKYQYQEGFFVREIPAFNEAVIREAILNAVSHRDYRTKESVFIRQFPKKIEIISPGGFPPGITIENILWKQSPRNRRIAEVFSKCGLVERSGQGVNRMYEECIKESKLPPDFSGTDDYQVFLTLNGKVQEPQFVRFMEEIGKQKLASFKTEDFVVLDFVYRSQKVPEHLHERCTTLRELGVIERVGRKYILSRSYYSFIGKKGVYTRKRGLDRETNKSLLLKHIKDNKKTGSQMYELMDVLPAMSRDQIKTLLRELKREKQIYSVGRTKAGRWYPMQKEGNLVN